MSTGLAVFDTTVNETNLWLKAVQDEIPGLDRHQAYLAARTVMHALRDRLSPGGAMRVAAQMPLLLRGVFTEGWRPDETPIRWHTAQAFVAAVAEGVPPDFPVDAETATRSVIKVLWSKMDGGAIEKIKGEVPEAIRALWPNAPHMA